MTFRRALAAEDLWAGEALGLCLHGRKILLVNVDGAIHAYEDRCPHKGVELSRGRLADGVLTCWAHAWQYDARTGEGLNPRGSALRRLPVRLEGEAIWVDVDG